MLVEGERGLEEGGNCDIVICRDGFFYGEIFKELYIIIIPHCIIELSSSSFEFKIFVFEIRSIWSLLGSSLVSDDISSYLGLLCLFRADVWCLWLGPFHEIRFLFFFWEGVEWLKDGLCYFMLWDWLCCLMCGLGFARGFEVKGGKDGEKKYRKKILYESAMLFFW